MPRRPLIVAAVLTALMLVATFLFPAPALSDPTGAALPEGVRLAFPLLNIVLAPFFDTWDGVTLLAMSRLNAFLIGALILGAAWSIGTAVVERKLQWRRATARLALFVVGLGLFVFGGIAWRRPMAHIEGVPDSLLVVDLHSHTNVSHDVKGWIQGDFDLEASRRWHARGGYDAFFVTDHNRIDGWKGKTLEGSPTACPGEELSLWRAHIVVLGNTDSIPRGMYADSAPGIARLFQESERRWGGLTLASIPEYDENHFADLPQWIADGLDGFEVSNAAPKANEQSRRDRDSVITLARNSARWLAGVTDQHGMGATVQTWTLLKAHILPDSLGAVTPQRCREILATLSTGGATATQVIERHRVRADSPWPYPFTVIAVPWEGWRAARTWQMLSWLAWIWGTALVVARRGKRAGDRSVAAATSG